jgi:hypothetical protein
MSKEELHSAAKELGIENHENMNTKELRTAVLDVNVEKQLGEFKKKKKVKEEGDFDQTGNFTKKELKQLRDNE